MNIETLKHIGDCGFTVAWSYDEDPHGRGVFYVTFKAYEVAYDECQINDGPVDTRPHYTRAGATSSDEDKTTDLDDAEVYAHGSIKWDGCSTVWLGDGVHMCGQGSWQAHIDLMVYLWKRAGEIMQGNTLEDEFLPLTLTIPEGDAA